MMFNIPVEVKMTDEELMTALDNEILAMTWDEVKPFVESDLSDFVMEFKYRGQFVTTQVPRDYFIMVWYLMN